MKTIAIIILSLFLSGCGYTVLVREPVRTEPDPVVVIHPRPFWIYPYHHYRPVPHIQQRVIIVEKDGHQKKDRGDGKNRPEERTRTESRKSGNTSSPRRRRDLTSGSTI